MLKKKAPCHHWFKAAVNFLRGSNAKHSQRYEEGERMSHLDKVTYEIKEAPARPRGAAGLC